MNSSNNKKPKSAAKATKDGEEISLDQELRHKFSKKRESIPVDKYFRALVKLEGSDLHMKVGRAPLCRVDGTLQALNRDPVTAEEMVTLLLPMLDDRNKEIFREEGGADFAYVVEVDGVEWRFRVNMLQQLGKMGLVARRVNNFIPNFEGLHPVSYTHLTLPTKA